jgi:hypothetical protein
VRFSSGTDAWYRALRDLGRADLLILDDRVWSPSTLQIAMISEEIRKERYGAAPV